MGLTSRRLHTCQWFQTPGIRFITGRIDFEATELQLEDTELTSGLFDRDVPGLAHRVRILVANHSLLWWYQRKWHHSKPLLQALNHFVYGRLE